MEGPLSFLVLNLNSVEQISELHAGQSKVLMFIRVLLKYAWNIRISNNFEFPYIAMNYFLIWDANGSRNETLISVIQCPVFMLTLINKVNSVSIVRKPPTHAVTDPYLLNVLYRVYSCWLYFISIFFYIYYRQN